MSKAAGQWPRMLLKAAEELREWAEPRCDQGALDNAELMKLAGQHMKRMGAKADDDVARVERVREALDAMIADCPEWGIAYKQGLTDGAKRIRAALDGGGGTHVPRKPSGLEVVRGAADAFREAASDLRQALMNLCLLPSEDREEIAIRAVEIICSDEWEMHVCGWIADRIKALDGGGQDG